MISVAMGERTPTRDQMPDLELTPFNNIQSFNTITSRGRKLFFVWLVLLALTFIPWPWFYRAEPLISGWLPFPLLYFWVVEFIYVSFVIYVGVTWAESKMDAKDELSSANTSNLSREGDA